MNEILQFIQHNIVNKTFLAVLIAITINNIWKNVDIKSFLQFIRYILIGFGVLSLINYCYSLFFETESEDNFLHFLNRASGPMKYNYLFMVISSVFSPILLLFINLGRKKYIILTVSFLIVSGVWFEKFVIITTSLYRGHMPASWSLYYNWKAIFILLIITAPLILLIFNITMDIIKRVKK